VFGEDVSSLHVGIAVLYREDTLCQRVVHPRYAYAMHPLDMAQLRELARLNDLGRGLIVLVQDEGREPS